MLRRLSKLECLVGFLLDVSDDIIIEVELRSGGMTLDSHKLFRLYGIPTSCNTLDRFMECFYSRLHAQDKRRFLSDFQVMSDGSFPINMRERMCEYRYLVSGEEYLSLRLMTSTCFDAPGEGILFIQIKNLTSNDAPSVAADYESERDSLTGAYKLHALREKVDTHLSYRGAAGVLVVFQLGDAGLLRAALDIHRESEAHAEFMSLLRRNVRQEDFIARSETGDFVIFITGNRSRETLLRGVFEVAGLFSHYLRGRGVFGGITVKAGIASASEMSGGFDALLSSARNSLAPVE